MLWGSESSQSPHQHVKHSVGGGGAHSPSLIDLKETGAVNLIIVKISRSKVRIMSQAGRGPVLFYIPD